MVKRTILIFLVVVVLIIVGVLLFTSKAQFVENGELTDGFMEEYLDAYAKMNEKGEQENILTIVSDKRPDGYGAIDVVVGPNHTYFLMYDSAESRDEAYAKFKASDSATVDKNIKMHLVSHNSWGVEKMGLDKAIEAISDGGQAVKVAIIDTGLDVELFQTNYPDRDFSTYDIETSSNAPEDMVDHEGHGTHVTGIVADGTPGSVSIMAMRATKGEDDTVYSSDATTLIYKAISDGATVINLSLGAYEQVTSQKIALDYAKDMGVITAAAAGNDGKSDILYPAGYDNTLSVSAILPNLSFASFSNYGETIDFAAPGVNILSINGVQHGTSMATPHVAAAVAILKSYNPSLSFDDAKNLLIEHTQDLGDQGWDQQFGYGFIDFKDAEFCDGVHCDEFGIFWSENNQTEPKVEIDNRTGEVAEVSILEDGIKITANEACVAIISDSENNTYEKIPATKIVNENNSYKFAFEIIDDVNILVALKGDGDMDGAVTSADLNMINRSLISPTLGGRYRPLTNPEKIIFDLDNDDVVTPADLNLVNRSLISPTLAFYKAISW